MRKLKKVLIVTILVGISLFLLEYKGIIWHNSLFAMKYETKGLDVSHYQGKIDWKKVKDTYKYHFVFMKATEGKDYVDNTFIYNWKEAKKQGILAGAYHFFSMGSSGEEQANNFIHIVPMENDSLPPVIDIEIDLKYDPNIVREELITLTTLLEEHYKKKPILYVTYDTYNTYVKGKLDEYDIWIRDILKSPSLEHSNWLFWQYSNRGRVNGIDMYVDINVFNGNVEDFKGRFMYLENK